MANTKRITDAQIAEALRKNGGIISNVAKACDVDHSTISHRLARTPALQAIRKEAQESCLDLAESMLIKNIQKGDNTAIIFFLKTIGKHRGYVEDRGSGKITVEQNATGASRITVEFVGNDSNPEGV